MHENHRRPLLKARNDFRKARNAVNELIVLGQQYRESYHHARWQGLEGYRSLQAVKLTNELLIEAIEAYQAAAEVLEIVEYALRRA